MDIGTTEMVMGMGTASTGHLALNTPFRDDTVSMIFWLSSAVIVAAVFLGGSTASGFVGDVITQLLAVPLFILAGRHWVVGMAHLTNWRFADYAICLSLGGLAIILIVQLAPWPPILLSAWENHIPNFNSSTAASILPTNDSWHGFSTTPHASWAAAVSLLPCLGVFFGVCQLDARARFKLAGVISILGALSLLLGFAQVMQGAGSELRFFEITNPSEAVGFFANRNHFAALLYTTLILASVLLTISAGNFVARGTLSSRSILWFILSGILIVSILVGIAIARSRAGVILSAVALVGIVIMIFAGKQRGDKSRRAMQNSVSRLTAVMILLAIVFAAQFGVHRVMSRFDADPLQDLRFALSPATFKIAIEYLPLGSGLGSFMEVYANHEKTENLFNGYANRAHNDWAEIFLETGILGAAAIGLFLTWFGIRAFQIIRLRAKPGEENYLLLQRGAVLVIPLIMAHSLVDYPLRTTAVSVIFTCACALLVDHSKFSNKFT